MERIDSIGALTALASEPIDGARPDGTSLRALRVSATLMEDCLRNHFAELPQGLVIFRQLTIEGPLNLRGLQLDRSLSFVGCRFLEADGTAPCDVCVEDASFSSLELERCSLNKLQARGLSVSSALRLRGCAVRSQVWLAHCRVGGSMWMSGTLIEAEGASNNALNLYGARIDGALYGGLHQREIGGPKFPFTCKGTLRLIDASVEGVIDLKGAKIGRPGTTALSADRLKGTTLLMTGSTTSIEGRVSLVGAAFTTTVNLRGAEFRNPGEVALQLNGLKVGFRLRLDPSVVEGSIRMRNARLGVFTYGPDALESCRDLDAAGTTFDSVGYMDEKKGAEKAPPSTEDLVDLLCKRSPKPSSSPYVQLAAVLQRQGEQEKARYVGIEGAKARSSDRGRWVRGFQRVVGAPFAYGYKPENALFILVVTIIALGFFVSFRSSELAPNAKGSCGAAYPCLEPAVYAVDVVLPIIDLGQESSWHVDNASTTGQSLQWFVWASIAIGWLASTAFVVALQRHFRE